MAAVGSALDTEVADWDRVHDLNLKAPWLWSKAVVPHLLPAGGGAIVFTGSTSGMVGYRGVIAYTSSKGGLMNLTRSLALELAERNITVNTVSPGHLDTPMTRAFMTDPADSGGAGAQSGGPRTDGADQTAGATRRGRGVRRLPRLR